MKKLRKVLLKKNEATYVLYERAQPCREFDDLDQFIEEKFRVDFPEAVISIIEDNQSNRQVLTNGKVIKNVISVYPSDEGIDENKECIFENAELKVNVYVADTPNVSFTPNFSLIEIEYNTEEKGIIHRLCHYVTFL